MKITGVNVTRYAAGHMIELATDAGLTGIGIGAERAGVQIGRLVEATLVGEDPRAVTHLWQRMRAAQSQRGAAGWFNETLAILDVALWDLKAKAGDEPLWKTLGASRPKANAYASGVDLPLSDEELAAWYTRMTREYGLRGGKLRVGLGEERDLERLGRMRDALLQASSQPALSIDADQHWSPKQAIRRVREIEAGFDLAWIEGAAPSWDFPGLKQVSNAIRAAVCVGGNLGTLGEFLPHFHHRSADVIEIDIGAVGITGALQLADAAYGFELPVTLSAAPGNIQAHLAGAMPYFMSVEIVDPVPPARAYSTDVRIEQGWAIAGDAPGNGLKLDRKAPG